MLEVIYGINTLFLADLQLQAALGGPNGLIHGIADENTPFPYATMRVLPGNDVGGSTEQKTKIQTLSVRFQVYATSDMEAGVLADRLESKFARGFTIPNGRIMSVSLRAEGLFEDPDRTSNEREVWQGIKDIEYTIKRDFTTPVTS